MTRYITRIVVDGFQSHDHTELNLQPGVVAITGPSNNGKTAILRAVRWALWNIPPEGDQSKWMRLGCTRAACEVTFNDGTVILREKTVSPNRNRYTFTLPGQAPETMTEPGKQVPKEILRAHGMFPVRLDPEKPGLLLNFASQLEAPFFLDASATARSRILGRLAGVTPIDNARDDARADVLARSKDIKRTEAEIAGVDQQLTAFADLDEQRRHVEQAERFMAEIDSTTQRVQYLQETAQLWRGLQDRIQATQGNIDRLQEAAGAVVVLQQAQAYQMTVMGLVAVQGRLGRNVADTERTSARICLLGGAPEALHLLQQAQSHQTRLATLKPIWGRHDRNVTDTARSEGRFQRFAGATKAVQLVGEALSAETGRLNLVRIRDIRTNGIAAWKASKAAVARVEGAPKALEAITQAEIAARMLTPLLGYRTTLQRQANERDRIAKAVRAAEIRKGADVHLQAAATLNEEVNRLNGLRTRLSDSRGRIQSQERRLADAQAHMTAVSERYARTLQEVGVCPTCLQPITEHVAAHVAGLDKGVPQHV